MIVYMTQLLPKDITIMTEKNYITIYDLLPLLRKGWVAMQPDGTWAWFDLKPSIYNCRFYEYWYIPMRGRDAFCVLSRTFNIAPFEGDWKDSLMEVK